MNGIDETWIRDRAHTLGEVTPPAPFPTGADVVARAEHARRRRALRRGAGGLTALVAAGAAVVAVLSVHAVREAPRPDVARPTPTPAAVRTTLVVTCTPTGTEVDGTTVATSPDGVHLRVLDRSGRPESILGYQPTASTFGLGVTGTAGGGGRLETAQTDLVALVPPGGLRVFCKSPAGPRLTPRTVTVEDVGGWYRPTTLPDAGCPVGGIPSWVRAFRGQGTTPEAAGRDLATGRDGFTDMDARVDAPAVGYVGAGPRPVILYRGGRPAVLAVASRSGATWTATPDYICGTAKPAPRQQLTTLKVDACGSKVGGVPDYAAGVEGEHVAPLELVRRTWPARYPGSRAVVAGSAPGRSVIAVVGPGDAVHAVLEYQVADAGGWQLQAMSYC